MTGEGGKKRRKIVGDTIRDNLVGEEPRDKGGNMGG